eukprot:TRINITY_DN70652_c0_g1_i1.p1 TRINITY_DN70652_c0_g1~~TRINITY_DN70652_c0_g1_i1.p1  ORF type:complete len:132 (+),score=5.62 TRINITY_DN70652_c0_g1_i1:22-396(+)
METLGELCEQCERNNEVCVWCEWSNCVYFNGSKEVVGFVYLMPTFIHLCWRNECYTCAKSYLICFNFCCVRMVESAGLFITELYAVNTECDCKCCCGSCESEFSWDCVFRYIDAFRSVEMYINT